MKLVGHWYDELEGYSGEVREAIVTKSRIAMSWDWDGDLFHASLKSSDGGSSYKGHFGESGDERGGKMTVFSYRSPDGDYLLWLEWHREDTGFEGTAIVDLTVP